MDKTDYLAAIESESDSFIAAALQNLDAVVAHCDDWAMHDLAVHMGSVWQFATANVLAATHAPSPGANPFPKDHHADPVDLGDVGNRHQLDAAIETTPSHRRFDVGRRRGACPRHDPCGTQGRACRRRRARVTPSPESWPGRLRRENE